MPTLLEQFALFLLEDAAQIILKDIAIRLIDSIAKNEDNIDSATEKGFNIALKLLHIPTKFHVLFWDVDLSAEVDKLIKAAIHAAIEELLALKKNLTDGSSTKSIQELTQTPA